MLQFHPSIEKFCELARDANTVPVYTDLLSDQLTPVSAFHNIADGADNAFLLESVVGGEKIARYSFLSADPVGVLAATRDTVTYTSRGKTSTWQCDDPLVKLEELLAGYRAAQVAGLPRFVGGAVGYVGYDAIRYYEHLPDAPADDRGLPDVYFGIYDQMVVFDHVEKRIKVVVYAPVDSRSAEAAYEDATRRIKRLVEQLSQVCPQTLLPVVSAGKPVGGYESNFERADFERAVDTCKEYIRAGDIFQVVISQRLSVETTASAFDMYRALRAVNPSPFMFYLRSPSATLVGASPEVLVRVENDRVTTRPLAGTRPRGRTESQDLALEKELLDDPKERAEHVMLVDLGRNDLGRVALPGSLKLDELMTVERYAHVMHICSNVTATLAGGRSAFDALRAVLPVGTVSGAPKIRAMQIIDELEPTRRGPYGGAVGYVDFAGNMDTCIALRTLVITDGGKTGRKVYAQVGAGIVADSEPAAEYAETLHKAASLLTAIDVARQWQGRS